MDVLQGVPDERGEDRPLSPDKRSPIRAKKQAPTYELLQAIENYVRSLRDDISTWNTLYSV